MDLELFFGRFHPLIVHLPIGFLLLAAILESLSFLFKNKFENLRQPIAITLLCSGFGAAASAYIGYLLAENGGYDEDTLFWHKWLGISLAVLSFIAWALKANVIIKLPQKVGTFFILTLVVLVSITGHLGGNLTHGSDYLFAYAPDFVKSMAGYNQEENDKSLPASVDSIQVFAHLVKPMLEAKCYSCHNESKSNGGLMLSSKEAIEKGGDTGKVIAAGDAFSSPLFLRTTLAKSNAKFMPPKGEPLTYSEIKILKWWIESGSDYDFKVKDNKIPAEIQKLLLRDYDIDTKPKPYYDAIVVQPIAENILDELSQNGWNAQTLATGHSMLDVSMANKEVSMEQISLLQKATEQITWLDLANKAVKDEMLEKIGQFPNLTRLDLNNNSITDEGLKFLAKLQHIEVLNMYGTDITDEGLDVIKEMKSLKSIYIWQTKVTSEGIEKLKEASPDIKIVGGAKAT